MITGIIMASGFSKRMVKNKLLLKIDGEMLIERTVKTIKKSKVDEIIITYREDFIKLIGKKYNINTVYNDSADAGQSSSIKIGIQAASTSTEGYMFFVGDQPFLSNIIIDKLINEFNTDKSKIIIPLYGGSRGNPVIFPSSFEGELMKLEGDVGGRIIIMSNHDKVKYIDIDDSQQGEDVDTWEEYLRLIDKRDK
ncbi:molybdenum cofactor cytidylyltransferase [Clostridium sp. D2Q-14]|uniref:molybdenum cofactor cytidylyltransferase n=1 Tax=Anaeromonas gelatinilytica TaxID=2683194 RepID=UPI00193BC7A9|nr:molybdenum cofactor cytidylyltransferase [Anaeromonas gelatinilytica]MBS4534568.1 molybdenum cofactor cytidylyltransferase [Anaeromonas gelatinilytica]